MMATLKSEVFDDRKSIDAPPTYDEISLSASLLDSVHSISCRRPSLFSFLRKKEKQTIVLSRIRDIVSAPNLTPSSITKIVNACAATLTPVQFAHLLQKTNIEGHTALYWSIVNHRRETFSTLATFIPQFTPVCSSDLRLACIATSDHELFTQLNLGHVINPEDESLRKFLGCPPDEVQVHSVTGHTPHKNEFVASFRIRMFQKRLHANPTQTLGIEFIAKGHTWLLRFCIARKLWCIALSLSEGGLPVCVASSVLVIQAPSGKTPLEDIRKPHPNKKVMLKPMVCVNFKLKHTDGFMIHLSTVGNADSGHQKAPSRSIGLLTG
ncbi:hypothetical protein BD769DRAFT_479731 [Suillus cothurnatus]|nr:hypothetical protein BD769DRAFT_479731 [Suillus cothurnatus]